MGEKFTPIFLNFCTTTMFVSVFFFRQAFRANNLLVSVYRGSKFWERGLCP